jgi:hypothetical protein
MCRRRIMIGNSKVATHSYGASTRRFRPVATGRARVSVELPAARSVVHAVRSILLGSVGYVDKADVCILAVARASIQHAHIRCLLGAFAPMGIRPHISSFLIS